MTSKLYARFATDTKKEEDGVWVDFGDGIKFKVRRMKSEASQKVRKELEKPFTGEIRRGKLDDDVAKDLLLKQIAWGAIVDWDGVTDRDGTALPYNRDNAYLVLSELPELADQILELSIQADNFREQLDEGGEKNLPTT